MEHFVDASTPSAIHAESLLPRAAARQWSESGFCGRLAAALTAFDGQFKDVILYRLERRNILAAYREFVERAARDPDIQALVERLHIAWRAGIVEALRRGQSDGFLRVDIDPEAAAAFSVLPGDSLPTSLVRETSLMPAARQLRSWLVKSCSS